ncbi:MAG: hypothetical protein ACE5EN_11645 [Nitrospinota bacterium]
MANAVNTALQTQVRTNSKKAMADLSSGRIKSGKETVREGHQKELRKSVKRHSAMLQKFVAEQGKGSSVDFNL